MFRLGPRRGVGGRFWQLEKVAGLQPRSRARNNRGRRRARGADAIIGLSRITEVVAVTAAHLMVAALRVPPLIWQSLEAHTQHPSRTGLRPSSRMRLAGKTQSSS